MGLLDWFQSRWKSESKRYKYVPVAPGNVDLGAGETVKEEPFTAGDHYFRLWLVEMFLANDREWFTDWHPAVHAAISFQFGDQKELITRVTGSSLLPDLSNENLNRAVGLNYAMTPLMPFNGGSIEMSAGLLALAGKNDVKGFLKVLGDFSNLLMVPQLSTALAIAEPLAKGLAELVGATENQLMLGLHQTWTAGSSGAAPLRAGYFAVILADESELDNDQLWVKNGRLLYGPSQGTAGSLRRFNYMLFRLERRDERDDWSSLMAIQDPYNKAIEMLRVGNTDQADAYIRSSKAAAFMANELTRNVDQRRVVTQIQKRYDEAKETLGLGAFPDRENESFSYVMQGAMPINDAKALGSLLPEDVGLEGLSVPEIEGELATAPSGAVREEESEAKPQIELEVGNRRSFGLDAIMREKPTQPRKSRSLDDSGEMIEPKSAAPEPTATGEQFYFALEGDAAEGDAVQFGTNVDLVFDYALVERAVVAVLHGRDLDRARQTDSDLGVTVIPKGFTFREEDSDWYKVARFRGGKLAEIVRFRLRAIDEAAAEMFADPEVVAEDALPILKTGFQIIFAIDGITLYNFPLAVRLVASIAADKATATTRPPLVLDLDKSTQRARKAREIIAQATGAVNFDAALRRAFEPESELRTNLEGRSL